MQIPCSSNVTSPKMFGGIVSVHMVNGYPHIPECSTSLDCLQRDSTEFSKDSEKSLLGTSLISIGDHNPAHLEVKM